MKKISKYRVMHLRMKSQMRWLVTSLFVTVILLSTLLNKDFATNLIWPPKAIAKGCLQSVGNSGLVVSTGSSKTAGIRAPIPYVLAILGECQDYVRHHLWQFTRFNNAPVHLISASDCSIKFKDISPTIHFHRSAKYNTYAEDFETNVLPRILPNGQSFNGRRHFELMCYTRWYVIMKFMEEHAIERIFSADADTMIYGNVTDYLQRYHANDDLALIWNYPHVSNSFISFTYRAIVDMISFWNTFLANLPTLLPNVEEHWAHNIMNDMTSSMMYGVAAICLGDKSPVIVQVEADMLKCADMLITFGTRGYWRTIVGDVIYNVLFADALSAIFRTVALNCTNIPRYIPSTLGPHPSRPTFFDNNIGDWYEMRFYRLKGTTTKQVNYIRGQPHLLAVDPTISSLPRQDSASSNKGLYPVMGLHFQGGMKGWMATYRVDPRTHCQNFTCVCMSETCEECYC